LTNSSSYTRWKRPSTALNHRGVDTTDCTRGVKRAVCAPSTTLVHGRCQPGRGRRALIMKPWRQVSIAGT